MIFVYVRFAFDDDKAGVYIERIHKNDSFGKNTY